MKPLGDTIFTLLLSLLCAQELNLFFAYATSVLRPGDHLNSSRNLVSHGGQFTLGFFTARVTNYSYIGIWYTDDDEERKVWVANPNTPLINASGVLTIDSSGTLKIINGGSTIINISHHVGTSNTSAILNDSGNFVLFDAIDNRTLWQSFDHPTNTLLPGMRLGFNRTSGKNWTLTSWLSNEVLASGAFALGLEAIQRSGQLVVRHRGELYWTSGPWINYSFQYFDADSVIWFDAIASDNDANAMYLTFDNIRTKIRMMTLNSMGEIEVVVTNSSSIIKHLCNGCKASARPTCRGPDDGFWVSAIADFPHFRGTYGEDPNLSLGDCKLKCWNDCSCVAFAALYPNGTGCIIWAKDGKDFINMNGINIEKYVLESRVDTIKDAPKSRAWILPVLIVLALVLLSVFMIVMSVLVDKKRRRSEELLRQLTTLDGLNGGDEIEKNGREPHDLKTFSFGLIKVATNNFSSENKLGEGGFGPVYKGKLHDGREIAIKRLAETSGQGIQEFKNELIFVSKLQHNNLVRVLGCCIHQEEKMLIYEFMPNKSLDFFLFAQDRRERLDWQTRFNIMEGIAQGLLYLHKYSRMRVIHRDLKASNILLDENMHPKIADFGIARIFKQNEIEAITSKIMGTYGYMSPEYAMEGTFSVKSDVFSFGILVLEIVSGKRNTSFFKLDRTLNLIGYAWHLWKQGNGLELKDPLLDDSSDMNQILRAIHVGLLCVQENAVDRPNMEDVLSMISNDTMPSVSPKQPAYFTGRDTLDSTHNCSEDEAIGNLVQNFPITEIEAL